MANDVLHIKPFVPCKDFETSRAFYSQLGFVENFKTESVAEFEVDGNKFLLQNFYQEQLAANFMLQLIVKDVNEWWQHLQECGVLTSFDNVKAEPPSLQPWGQTIAYLWDPCGVLWHIAEANEG